MRKRAQTDWNHGGDLATLADRLGCSPSDITDFSANLNPLGPPLVARAAAARALDDMAAYPDPLCRDLTRALASYHEITEDKIVCGNGSTELFMAVCRAISPNRMVIPSPAYVGYREIAASLSLKTVKPELSSNFTINWKALESLIEEGDVVMLGHPNNPTGTLLDPEQLRAFCSKHTRSHFIVDESFLRFVPDEMDMTLVGRRPGNVTVIRSMTKFYAMAGLRLGYACGNPDLIGLTREALPSWSVNTVAQYVGTAVLNDAEFDRDTKMKTLEWRKELADNIEKLGVSVLPSACNFLLCRLGKEHMNARLLSERLLEHKLAIRVCDNFDGLDKGWFRIAVRTPAENTFLAETMETALGKQRRNSRKRTPVVMIQGTSSGAGKSFLVTGLCRTLHKGGIRVAPFKAQNMALNSCVTSAGDEMGRSQATQAVACGLEPDVRMNPLLLKPMGPSGCQVVLEGKAVGVWNAEQQALNRQRIEEVVMRCYNSLSEEFDAIVIEGAGSPAEINLRNRDIVNMAMALKVKAPVLLAGDIDRGGVFAALTGTMELLSDSERRLVAGFIINKMRGNQEELSPAIEYITRRCGKPVLGVLPYLESLYLPEEDSVSFRAGRYDKMSGQRESVDIAVLELPHLSNFTDLDPLAAEPDVSLRRATTAGELGKPDAVIIPGSKNTASDLRALIDSGMAGAIREASRNGSVIVGLCAGLQMLGSRVIDNESVEGGSFTGLGLLSVRTVMKPEKVLSRVSGKHIPSGTRVEGYEIHHGRTQSEAGTEKVVESDDGAPLGYGSADGRTWGTYLHGVFDSDQFRRWFINDLRQRRGLNALTANGYRHSLDRDLDTLADAIREHLDMDCISRIMGL